MTPAQFDGLMPIVILMSAAILMFAGGHFVSVLLAPKKPSHLKSTPYECGEQPVGSAWSAFNVRFYVVGLIFIIFDVESVLMFPVAAIFRELNEMGHGGYALIIFLSFISVLIEGIAYCWKKGDLDWVKSFQVSHKTSNKG
jgi:NADH-quinone oxidoreductase subunit A